MRLLLLTLPDED